MPLTESRRPSAGLTQARALNLGQRKWLWGPPGAQLVVEQRGADVAAELQNRLLRRRRGALAAARPRLLQAHVRVCARTQA